MFAGKDGEKKKARAFFISSPLATGRRQMSHNILLRAFPATGFRRRGASPAGRGENARNVNLIAGPFFRARPLARLPPSAALTIFYNIHSVYYFMSFRRFPRHSRRRRRGRVTRASRAEANLRVRRGAAADALYNMYNTRTYR